MPDTTGISVTPQRRGEFGRFGRFGRFGTFADLAEFAEFRDSRPVTAHTGFIPTFLVGR